MVSTNFKLSLELYFEPHSFGSCWSQGRGGMVWYAVQGAINHHPSHRITPGQQAEGERATIFKKIQFLEISLHHKKTRLKFGHHYIHNVRA